jgi:hypothetical protein
MMMTATTLEPLEERRDLPHNDTLKLSPIK